MAPDVAKTFTSRPNSLISGYTLRTLFGLSSIPQSDPAITIWNWATHYGEGALAGGTRGVIAFYGVSGCFANFMFTGIKLLIDQSAENLTGVGVLPWTWPQSEQVLDVLHKGVFACFTGWLTDLWV